MKKSAKQVLTRFALLSEASMLALTGCHQGISSETHECPVTSAVKTTSLLMPNYWRFHNINNDAEVDEYATCIWEELTKKHNNYYASLPNIMNALRLANIDQYENKELFNDPNILEEATDALGIICTTLNPQYVMGSMSVDDTDILMNDYRFILEKVSRYNTCHYIQVDANNVYAEFYEDLNNPNYDKDNFIADYFAYSYVEVDYVDGHSSIEYVSRDSVLSLLTEIIRDQTDKYSINDKKTAARAFNEMIARRFCDLENPNKGQNMDFIMLSMYKNLRIDITRLLSAKTNTVELQYLKIYGNTNEKNDYNGYITAQKLLIDYGTLIDLENKPYYQVNQDEELTLRLP